VDRVVEEDVMCETDDVLACSSNSGFDQNAGTKKLFEARSVTGCHFPKLCPWNLQAHGGDRHIANFRREQLARVSAARRSQNPPLPIQIEQLKLSAYAMQAVDVDAIALEQTSEQAEIKRHAQKLH
jgi:hypothetical protein